MATPVTDTELREVLAAIVRLEAITAANHAAISQRMEVGFAQMETKLVEAKAELKSEIQRVEGKVDVIDERTKLGFWGFVGRAVIVSAFSFTVLLAIKYALTGTIKLT
jgi:hypothetical protein